MPAMPSAELSSGVAQDTRRACPAACVTLCPSSAEGNLST